MKHVLKLRKMAVAGFLVGLAGCSTGSRPGPGSGAPYRSSAQPPDSSPETVEYVRDAPRLAPPPTSVPELTRPHPNSYAETWIPLARWSRQNGCGPLRQVSSGPEPAFALGTSNGVFSVQINSLVANWEGLELHLGFEPQLIDHQPFVHLLDLKKNLEPLISGFALPATANKVVVIDPGHGGQNTGAASVADGVYEKEFTLDWARRLVPLLENQGWQVFLTRTNDVDVALIDRVGFAEEHQANLFISLHFNSAAPSQDQAGVETYCLTPAGMPSTLTRGYEDDPAVVFANNAFDAENLQYAVRFHRALLSVTGNDRGIRHARFLGVLRRQNRPAVLIEGGYLSNPHEAQQIADPAYRQKLAEAVAATLSPETGNGKTKTVADEE